MVYITIVLEISRPTDNYIPFILLIVDGEEKHLLNTFFT